MNFSATAGFGGGGGFGSTRPSAQANAHDKRKREGGLKILRALRAWRARRRAAWTMVASALAFVDEPASHSIADDAAGTLGLLLLRTPWLVSVGCVVVSSGARLEEALRAVTAVFRLVLEDCCGKLKAGGMPGLTATSGLLLQLLSRAKWNKGRLADALFGLHRTALLLLATHDRTAGLAKAAGGPGATTRAAELRVVVNEALSRLFAGASSWHCFRDEALATSGALKVMKQVAHKSLVVAVAKRLLAPFGPVEASLHLAVELSLSQAQIDTNPGANGGSVASVSVTKLWGLIGTVVAAAAPAAAAAAAKAPASFFDAGEDPGWDASLAGVMARVFARVPCWRVLTSDRRPLAVAVAEGMGFEAAAAFLHAVACGGALRSDEGSPVALHDCVFGNVAALSTHFSPEALQQAGKTVRLELLPETGAVLDAASPAGSNGLCGKWMQAVARLLMRSAANPGEIQHVITSAADAAGASGKKRATSRQLSLTVCALDALRGFRGAGGNATLRIRGGLTYAVSNVLIQAKVSSAILAQCGARSPASTAAATSAGPSSLFRRLRKKGTSEGAGGQQPKQQHVAGPTEKDSSIARPTIDDSVIGEAYAAPVWLLFIRVLDIVATKGGMASLLSHFLTTAPELCGRLWEEFSSPIFSALLCYAFAKAPAASRGQPARAVAADLCAGVSFLFALFAHALVVFGDDEWIEGGVPFRPHVDGARVIEFANSFLVRGVMAQVFQTPDTIVGGDAMVNALGHVRKFLRAAVDRAARVPGVFFGDTAATSVRPEVAALLWALTPIALRDCQAALMSITAAAGTKAATTESSVRALGLLEPKRANATAQGSRKAASGENRQRVDNEVLELATHPLVRAVAGYAPHALPFSLRAEFLRCFVGADRRMRGVDRVKAGFKIRRERILDDSYQQVMAIVDASLLKARFHVEFVGHDGKAEAGIDAGGIFKEFMDLVAKKIFDPDLGLFRVAEGGTGYIYPNPLADRVFGPEWRQAFRFAGRVIGKGIYEGVQLPVRFAPFALNAVLGRGYALDDLRQLDPDHYRSLVKLKEMPDVADAGLVFVDDESFMGEVIEHELVPGGGGVDVTSDNLVRYLHLLAYHRLVGRTSAATACFVEGLRDVLDMGWLRGFSAPELQQAISGRVDQVLSVSDIAQHCKLVNYAAKDRTIGLLWEVLTELSDDDKGRFLAFCTGSSRPPLLGFESMQPPFTIARADYASGAEGSVMNYVVDIERLPTASTCFNLLKLPPYRNKSNLRDKLVQAIRAESGFQLS